jgi:uncharacterized protein (DUF433 family)
MMLTIEKVDVPLAATADGAIRVIGTRIPIQTIVHTFNLGATAEEIVYRFPTLKLADVYSVISFYLNHKSEVDEYVAAIGAETERTMEEIEAKYGSGAELRARLLARKREREQTKK